MARAARRGKHASARTRGLVDFAREHPARLYSVAASGLTLVAIYVPGLPQDALLALLAALLWGGDVVQRTENGKTLAAGMPRADESELRS
ncbi:hypothetical protein [Streptomyces rimosus]|uniref:hypothetical protein n=1 Tax=Streptomyces rimosus TaxID=1927 RepID=UPI0004C093EC|nr:hypothetical protein [Streptomyces rimosus]